MFGHEADTARSLGWERASDAKHIQVAAENGWILVTHDRKNFEALQDAWLLWQPTAPGHPHRGIFCCQALPADELAVAINGLVGAGTTVENEMYEWRRGSGWTRYTPNV